MTTNPPLTREQEKRLKLYCAMPPATRRLAENLANCLGDPNFSRVMQLYDVGYSTIAVEYDEGTYGGLALVQLAQFLDLRGGAKRLSSLANFARSFKREFVDETTENATGSHLSAEHWELLAGLLYPTDRLEMLKRAVEQKLSIKELKKVIKTSGKPVKRQFIPRSRIPLAERPKRTNEQIA